MRIAIDARLNAYRRGGIPQYTRQLLTALSEIAIEEQFISLQHRDMLRPLAVAPNVTRRTIYTPPHHRFERWILPFEVALARPDVLHFPDFIAPTFRPCPAVVTIHDLAFMHYPQILDDAARAFYQQVLTNTHRADAVIAVSEATRQDIVQFLDVPVDDVKVIYEAAAPMFRHMELRPGEARVLNGKPVAAGTFMLFVSTLEPRKNLPTLLQGLRICLDRNPARPYKLVIVGGRGWNDEPIFEAIRDLRLADHVLLAGSVGQYDLRWLYNACQFYINPSLYEGFGLPLLEAMACGAACLAAATSSLPEIAGDAALYVPPLEPDQWADAMEDLWDNTERQQELGRIGQARAHRFSWARAARETLQLYYHVVERGGQPLAPRVQVPAPARRTAQPPQPAVVLPSAFGHEGAERTCLRCNTPMLPGELQQHLRIQLAGEDGSETPVQPRAWACPNCGYAELVVEPLVVPVASAVAAVPDDDMEDRAEASPHVETAATPAAADTAADLPAEAFDHEAFAHAEPAPMADAQAVIEEPAAPEATFADAEAAVLSSGDEAAPDDYDAADEPVAQFAMDEAPAPDSTPDVYQAPDQTPDADAPPSRDTLVLPALERDEAADAQPPAAGDEHASAADAPPSRDTLVLPALERDETAGMADPPHAEADESVQPQEAMEAHAHAEADESVQPQEAMEAHAHAEADESVEQEFAEAHAHADGDETLEPQALAEAHEHADEPRAVNGTHDLTPLARRQGNAGRATPAAPNGRREARNADAPNQLHSKRRTTSAKISRAANHRSASSTPDMPDADPPRRQSRSRRKK